MKPYDGTYEDYLRILEYLESPERIQDLRVRTEFDNPHNIQPMVRLKQDLFYNHYDPNDPRTTCMCCSSNFLPDFTQIASLPYSSHEEKNWLTDGLIPYWSNPVIHDHIQTLKQVPWAEDQHEYS